jgi:high affinity choline transporter 7
MPFVLTSEPVAGNWENKTSDWLGTIPEPKMASWIDAIIMLMLGGIPWQGYFQRVLSASSDESAKILSFCGAIGTTLLVIPPVVIGASARIADWSLTSLGNYQKNKKKTS